MQERTILPMSGTIMQVCLYMERHCIGYRLIVLYVIEIGQDKAQAIIDEITKAYENSAAGKDSGIVKDVKD